MADVLVRILIVDDHAVVRTGLRAVLAGTPGFQVVAEAGNIAEALAFAAQLRPTVILLDITMPGGSGLEALPRLRAVVPEARVLMLSVHDRLEYVLEAVKAGAHGYLRKDTTPADLRAAVRSVADGGAFFSPDVARHLTAAIRGDVPASAMEPPGAPGAADPSAASRVATLTAREREVLAGVARGSTNKAMAADLGISVRTVEAHRDSLMKKLGIRTVAGLTKLALEGGLLNAS